LRALLQRVSSAKVLVEGEIISSIRKGLLIYLGVGADDTEADARQLADKVGDLRIFADSEGKTNLSIKDVSGEALIVSQFTLYANCRKGNRPSFTEAAGSEKGLALYELFVELFKTKARKVAKGQFAAHMSVFSENDGPFTLILDSRKTTS
jgi:D-tyrosyl-tRNA(Tyr) deacylase